MSQHDYIISNDTGANVRSDLNNALSAIATVNSGATEPSTTYAYQLWMDTANNVLKMRNSANSAWYTLPISPVANNTVDINAGTIDGASVAATSLSSTGTTALQNLSTTNSALNISSSASDGSVTIDASGRVGIATISPAQKLDVNGSIKASGIYLGGTGAANYLDDYEEGTWTPIGIAGNFTGTVDSASGTYTKVGRKVTYTFVLTSTSGISFVSTSRYLAMSGLPFVNSSTLCDGSAGGERASGISASVKTTSSSSTLNVYAVISTSTTTILTGTITVIL